MVIGSESDGVAKPQPGYLRIAALLRADIVSGRIGPGGKLPSETQMMIRHGVSRSVAKWAIAVLKADGLVDGKRGAGVFARIPHRISREPHWPGLPPRTTGRTQPGWIPSQPGPQDRPADPWTHQEEEIPADLPTARRLAIKPGAPVLRISGRYTTQAEQALITSWRPVTTSRQADEQCERVIVRPATPEEIAGLALPARGSVLAITSTCTARGVPVVTADIVLPGDRYELVYRLPLSGEWDQRC